MVTNAALRMFVTLRTAVARLQDEEGQTLAEYGLILSIISVFVMSGAAVILRTQIESAFNNAAACMDASC